MKRGHVRAERLPIRFRQTVSGDGTHSSAPTVYCPTRETSVELGVCEACDAVTKIHLDPSEHDSFLVCRPQRHPAARAVRWTVRPPASGFADRTPIQAVMARDVLCLTLDVSVEDAARLLLERRVGAAPVVDSEGFPVGVLSMSDLLRIRLEPADDGPEPPLVTAVRGVVAELGPGFHCERLAAATVGETMMPIAFTLDETAPLSQAAALMTLEHVHQLPVVSSDGKVVGLLSSLDVMRWLAAQSGYEAKA